MTYFMLDLLFLIGDPRKSIPKMDYSNEKTKPDLLAKHPEKRVRIDRTSQLLVAMSIAIADFVK